jgi:hypothetical protein
MLLVLEQCRRYDQEALFISLSKPVRPFLAWWVLSWFFLGRNSHWNRIWLTPTVIALTYLEVPPQVLLYVALQSMLFIKTVNSSVLLELYYSIRPLFGPFLMLPWRVS